MQNRLRLRARDGQLAVKCVWESGGDPVMGIGATRLPHRLQRPALPIFRAGLADRPGHVGGKPLEIGQCPRRFLQKTQRDKSAEELLFDKLLAGRNLGVVDQPQRQAGIAGCQRIARLNRHFIPPTLGMITGERSGLDAQQHGVGVLVLVRQAQGPRQVEQHGGVVGAGDFRQRCPRLGITGGERKPRLRDGAALSVHPLHLPPGGADFAAP